MTVYTCYEENCGRTYRRKYHLLRHQKNSHEQSRPHICIVCHHSFGRQDVLVRHARSHTKDKTSACDKEDKEDLSLRCSSPDKESENREPTNPGEKNLNADGTVKFSPLRWDNFINTGSYPFEGFLDFLQGISPLEQQIPEISLPLGEMHLRGSDDAELLAAFTKGQGEEYVPTDGICNQPRENNPAVSTPLPSSWGEDFSHSMQTNYHPVLATEGTTQAPSTTKTEDFQVPCGEKPSIFPARVHFIREVLQNSTLDHYMRVFHPRWPIIHPATFLCESTPLELRCMVGLLGCLAEEDGKRIDNAKSLHPFILESLAKDFTRLCGTGMIASISELLSFAQGLCLSILFSIYSQSHSASARPQVACLTEMIRNSGFLKIEEVVHHTEHSENAWRKWILREQIIRVTFVAFRLEFLVNFMDDLPPAMRYQEIEIPLPSTDAAWNASTSEEWEEAMSNYACRQSSTSFNILVSVLISELSLSARTELQDFVTPVRYELILCSVQSRLWEETKQYEFARGHLLIDEWELQKAELFNSYGYGHSWRVLLETWSGEMERSVFAPRNGTSNPGELSSYLTATVLYHSSMLRFYANISLFRDVATRLYSNHNSDNTNHHMSPAVERSQTKIQQWAQTYYARHALWHAAQILHVLQQQQVVSVGNNIIFSPEAYECIYRASLVVWAFTKHCFVCAFCMPVSSLGYGPLLSHAHFPRYKQTSSVGLGSERIELTLLEKRSDRYNKWLAERGPASIYNQPVCVCNMSNIIERYQQVAFPGQSKGNIGIWKRYAEIIGNLKAC